MYEAPMLPLTATTKTPTGSELWFLPATSFLDNSYMTNGTLYSNCVNYSLHAELPPVFLIDQFGAMSNESILQVLTQANRIPSFQDTTLLLISQTPIYNLDISGNICDILSTVFGNSIPTCEQLFRNSNISASLILVDEETAIQLRAFSKSYDCGNSGGCEPVVTSSLSSIDCLGAILVDLSPNPFPGSPSLMPNYFKVPVVIPLLFLFLAELCSLNVLLWNRLRLHPLRYFVPDPNKKVRTTSNLSASTRAQSSK